MLIGLEGAHGFCVSLFDGVEAPSVDRGGRIDQKAMPTDAKLLPQSAPEEPGTPAHRSP